MSELQMIFTGGRHFYAVPDVKRECGLWLSVEKHPLPVPTEWHRPGSVCAVVMRGRAYYRIGIFGPQYPADSGYTTPDDTLVRDYEDAAGWTPGLEEAWVELATSKQIAQRYLQPSIAVQKTIQHQKRK